ncbi:MAG: DUF1189 domain-containing protein [Clostridia bacterium]|nr:DUF1189 domain-containing protein [Clostridia bacterium]
MKEQENKELKTTKINFFKKVWYSITKLEKYQTLAEEGVGKSISYLAKLILIFAVIIAILGVIEVNNEVDEVIKYLDEEVPDFKYSDGQIVSDLNEVKRINDEEFGYGNIIIDLQTEDEETIKQYELELSKNSSESGLIILKDKLLQVRYNESTNNEEENNTDEIAVNQITYTTLSQNLLKTTEGEITKQQIIETLKGNTRIYLGCINFVVYLISYFIVYFMSTITYILVLSVIGYLTSKITKIKLTYSEVFAMSVYALTLSTILNIIYTAVNYFSGIRISFFQVAYIAIAYVYMVAVLFLMKYDALKKQNNSDTKTKTQVDDLNDEDTAETEKKAENENKKETDNEDANETGEDDKTNKVKDKHEK